MQSGTTATSLWKVVPANRALVEVIADLYATPESAECTFELTVA